MTNIDTNKIIGWDIETFSWPKDKCPSCGYTGEMLKINEGCNLCPECEAEAADQYESWGQAWEDFTPLGISCGGASFYDTQYHQWHDEPRDKMTKEGCLAMLENLETAVAAGWTIAAVNGSGFDCKFLAYETNEWERCARLMWGSVDLMFVSVCVKGWRLGLDAIAKGAGLHGKLKSVTLNSGVVIDEMSGKAAPAMWRAGETDAVLAYLEEDCHMTRMATQSVLHNRQIKWVSNAGNTQAMSLPQNPTVRGCMGLKGPNTSWMSNPIKREDIVGWALDYL